MSELEKLQADFHTIKQMINDRIQSANDKKLPGMARDVARNHGEYSDWGGGEYNYREKGLSINYSTYNQKYIKVNLGYETKEVFRASLLPNDVGDISLYIPGSWEERIKTLYEEIPAKKQTEKTQTIQKEINQLKEKWNLEGG